MSRRNPWGEFFDNFNSAYNLGNKVGMQIGLARASDVKTEKIETPNNYEQGMGLDGAPDQAKMLQEQDAAFGAEGADSTAQALNSNTADMTKADPAASVKTSYRMGETEQDTPFSHEQVDAQRFRNQAGVYSRFGMPDKAAAVQGLAKAKSEEATMGQIRNSAATGLKNTKDMRAEEKMFTASKSMYEMALKLNRPDLATGYYNQMNQTRDALMSRANDRADRVFRSTGNIAGYVDSYNKYLADGNTIDAFKRNPDGSHTLTINDGSGRSRDVTVPKERINEYLMALRDPKRVQELEARRAEILFKAQTESQAALNKPVAVSKDQTLIVPGTGQTFAPRRDEYNQKDSNPVLDDARKILQQRKGNATFGTIAGVVEWSPEGERKTVVAARLLMKNPSLPPDMLAEIADKGTLGQAVVDIGGQKQRVPAVSYNGRTFLLGGADAGMPSPGVDPSAAAGPAAAGAGGVATTGLGTRDVRGKIGPPRPASGLQRVAPAKTSTSTPADFPRVSSADQAGRDAEAQAIILREFAQEMPPETRQALEREFTRRFGHNPPTQQEAIAALS